MKNSKNKSRNTILFNGFGILLSYGFRESRIYHFKSSLHNFQVIQDLKIRNVIRYSPGSNR